MVEKKWEPSYPVKPADHTKFKLPVTQFIVSYEENKLPDNMKWIMAMEYQRIWLEENKKWSNLTYAKKSNEFFHRKVVNKATRPERKYQTEHVNEFKIKRFTNIPSKISTFRSIKKK